MTGNRFDATEVPGAMSMEEFEQFAYEHIYSAEDPEQAAWDLLVAVTDVVLQKYYAQDRNALQERASDT